MLELNLNVNTGMKLLNCVMGTRELILEIV